MALATVGTWIKQALVMSLIELFRTLLSSWLQGMPTLCIADCSFSPDSVMQRETPWPALVEIN